mgnify:CR=1 FL=1
MKPMSTITIDYEKKCKRCGNLGAMKNGLCMKCMSKAMKSGAFAARGVRRINEENGIAVIAMIGYDLESIALHKSHSLKK